MRTAIYALLVMLTCNSCSFIPPNIDRVIASSDINKMTEVYSQFKDDSKNADELEPLKAALHTYYSKRALNEAFNGEYRLAVSSTDTASMFCAPCEMCLSRMKKYSAVIDKYERLYEFVASSDTNSICLHADIMHALLNSESRKSEKKYFFNTYDIEKSYLEEIARIGTIHCSYRMPAKFVKLQELKSSSKFRNVNHRNRIRIILESYNEEMINSAAMNDPESRIYYMRLKYKYHEIDDWIPDEYENAAIKNIHKYYIGLLSKETLSIDDVYELFVYSRAINTSVQKEVDNEIYQYLSKCLCRLKYAYEGSESCCRYIKDRIAEEQLFGYRESINCVLIKVVVNDILVQINPETYRKRVRSKYLSGSHIEPNPYYSKLVNYVNELTAHYNSLISQKSNNDGSFLGALVEGYKTGVTIKTYNRLKEARKELSRTLPTIEIKDYTSYSFEEVGHSIKGNISISLIMIDGDVPAPPVSVDVNIDKELRSRLNVAPNDYYDYEEETNSLPTKQVLNHMLLSEAYEKISLRVQSKGDLSYDLDKIEHSFMKSTFQNHIENIACKKYIAHWEPIILGVKPSAMPSSSDNPVRYAAKSSCQIVSYNDDFHSASGTAYFINDDGYCITNAHVVSGKKRHILLRRIGNEIEVKNARLLYSSENMDLALLKVNKLFPKSTFLYINRECSVELGDEVLYVGYPATPISNSTNPFTSQGIVSQVIRNDNGNPILLLFDITANPGSSGSGIIKKDTGELIGTMTWGAGRSIDASDIIHLFDGNTVSIKESQNIGTSVKVLIKFLEKSGYLDDTEVSPEVPQIELN